MVNKSDWDEECELAVLYGKACMNAASGWTVERLSLNIQSNFVLPDWKCDLIAEELLGKEP